MPTLAAMDSVVVGTNKGSVGVASLLSLAKKASISVINSEEFLQAYAQNPKVLPVLGERLAKEIISDIKTDQKGILAKIISGLVSKELKIKKSWWIASVYWNANSKQIISKDAGNNTLEWDLESGKVLHVLEYEERLKLTQSMETPVAGLYKRFCDRDFLSYSPDEKWKSQAYSNGNAKVTNMDTGQEYYLTFVQPKKEYINNFTCWSPDGSKIATSSGEGLIIWDFPMIQQIEQLNLTELLDLCAQPYKTIAVDHGSIADVESIEKKSCMIM